uniref:Uncharacterized protein n=1 Tax=Arcella intermedia TaxID=1963864 RepID=A0A6B2KZU1_9EUKA
MSSDRNKGVPSPQPSPLTKATKKASQRFSMPAMPPEKKSTPRDIKKSSRHATASAPSPPLIYPPFDPNEEGPPPPGYVPPPPPPEESEPEPSPSPLLLAIPQQSPPIQSTRSTRSPRSSRWKIRTSLFDAEEIREATKRFMEEENTVVVPIVVYDIPRDDPPSGITEVPLLQWEVPQSQSKRHMKVFYGVLIQSGSIFDSTSHSSIPTTRQLPRLGQLRTSHLSALSEPDLKHLNGDSKTPLSLSQATSLTFIKAHSESTRRGSSTRPSRPVEGKPNFSISPSLKRNSQKVLAEKRSSSKSSIKRPEPKLKEATPEAQETNGGVASPAPLQIISEEGKEISSQPSTNIVIQIPLPSDSDPSSLSSSAVNESKSLDLSSLTPSKSNWQKSPRRDNRRKTKLLGEEFINTDFSFSKLSMETMPWNMVRGDTPFTGENAFFELQKVGGASHSIIVGFCTPEVDQKFNPRKDYFSLSEPSITYRIRCPIQLHDVIGVLIDIPSSAMHIYKNYAHIKRVPILEESLTAFKLMNMYPLVALQGDIHVSITRETKGKYYRHFRITGNSQHATDMDIPTPGHVLVDILEGLEVKKHKHHFRGLAFRDLQWENLNKMPLPLFLKNRIWITRNEVSSIFHLS